MPTPDTSPLQVIGLESRLTSAPPTDRPGFTADALLCQPLDVRQAVDKAREESEQVSDSEEFVGQNFLVVGGGNGIGASTVQLLRKRGARNSSGYWIPTARGQRQSQPRSMAWLSSVVALTLSPGDHHRQPATEERTDVGDVAADEVHRAEKQSAGPDGQTTAPGRQARARLQSSPHGGRAGSCCASFRAG